jgi:hypothetical protein
MKLHQSKIKCTGTIIAVVVMMILTQFAKAQSAYSYKSRFSIGANAGIPTGKLSDTHTIAFGGYLQETIPVYKALHVTINAGYTKFKGKSNVGDLSPNENIIDYPDIDMLAAKAGLRYFFHPGIFLQVDAGIAYVLNSPQTSYDAAKAFIYSPQIGVELPVSKKRVIDISIKYEATNPYGGAYRGNVNNIGISIAYGF